MDIRDWPLDQIMQLPDCCFGRRWPIRVAGITSAQRIAWAISEGALPERCVVWEIVGYSYSATIGSHYIFTLSLGDVLPTTSAEFLAYETFIRGLCFGSGFNERVDLVMGQVLRVTNLRVPVESKGRRLVAEFNSTVQSMDCIVHAVVSSIPTEVPDCLVSEYLRSL